MYKPNYDLTAFYKMFYSTSKGHIAKIWKCKSVGNFFSRLKETFFTGERTYVNDIDSAFMFWFICTLVRSNAVTIHISSSCAVRLSI